MSMSRNYLNKSGDIGSGRRIGNILANMTDGAIN